MFHGREARNDTTKSDYFMEEVRNAVSAIKRKIWQNKEKVRCLGSVTTIIRTVVFQTREFKMPVKFERLNNI